MGAAGPCDPGDLVDARVSRLSGTGTGEDLIYP